MLDCAVNAVLGQIDTIVGMLGSVIGAQEDQVCTVAEQIGSAHIFSALAGGQQEGAGCRALRLPFHVPPLVMHQPQRLAQTEAGIGVGTAGNTSVIDRRGV